MSTAAIIMMVLTMSVITSITVYLFVKVLRTPPKHEPDSYSENDELQR